MGKHENFRKSAKNFTNGRGRDMGGFRVGGNLHYQGGVLKKNSKERLLHTSESAQCSLMGKPIKKNTEERMNDDKKHKGGRDGRKRGRVIGSEGERQGV